MARRLVPRDSPWGEERELRISPATHSSPDDQGVSERAGLTGLSIGAAFIIGTIEILGILTTEFHLNGAFWNLMANFNINIAGFCIAGLFVAVWAAALIYF